MAFGDNDAVAFGLDDDEEGAPKGASSIGNFAKELGRGALGTAAAAGDILGGALKFPASRVAAVATKIRHPSYNWDELRNAADAATEEKFPSLGRSLGVDTSSGYTAPMKPFELLSEGVNKLGDVYGNITGGGAEAVGGAKMAMDIGMLAGIPGAKTVGKGIRKGIEMIDPALRNAGKEPANVRAVREAAEEQKIRNEQPQGVLFGTEDGVLSDTLPAKVTDQYAELAKTKQAEELANVARETELPQGEQMPLFDLDEMLPSETNPVGELQRPPEQIPLDLSFGKDTAPEPITPKSVVKETADQTNIIKDAAPVETLKGYLGTFNRDVINQAYRDSINPNSNERVVMMNPADFHILAKNRKAYEKATEQAEAQRESIRGALKDQGLDQMPYLMVDKDGRVFGHEGRHRMDVFQEQGMEKVPVMIHTSEFKNGDGKFPFNKISAQEEGGLSVPIDQPLFQARETTPAIIEPRSTMAGPVETIPPEMRPGLPDTIQTPRSEPMLAARAAEQSKADILRKASPEAPLKEWLDVNTLEEAYKLSEAEKDISSNATPRNMAAGIQGVTIMSGHPMLRYFRKAFADARGEIARLSETYITNKKDGFVTRVQELSPKESVGVVQLLNEADRQQVRITPEMMDKLAFNKKQRALVESFQRAADAEILVKNEVRKQLGFKPVSAREGWFPGIFKGSYKTLVWDKDGHIVGFIGQDTKLAQKAAIEHYKKAFPGAVFGTMTHQGLGRANKVDAFSGMSDVLAILAKEDPKMKALLDKSQEASSIINNKLFGIDKHDLQKKGITGNEGNKPWLSPEKNAKQALQSAAEYFEAAFEHHALQKPLHDVNKVVTNPEYNAPNVQRYLQEYANHVTGKTGRMGEAVNSAIDSAFDAFGIGSTIPLKGANAIKAGMSRMFMGFNPAFLASQLAQPFQLAFPLAGTFATRLGMPQHAVANAMGRGSVWALSENLAKWYDAPSLAIAPEHIKGALQYAKDRGLFALNELELAHNATRGKARRMFGQAADFTISTGDKATKVPTYLGFVELFKDAGIENPIAYALAEKATDSSMVNYHPWERPMMYQKMGVVGQFAGGLTTYKHASMNLQAKLVQEAFGEQKNYKPLIASGLAMMVFAGITGLPAYAELDYLYGKTHELYSGKPSTIREDFLQKLPEYAKSGAVSAASNLNMQAKWSAADMVPDSLAKAASPHLEGAYKIADAAAKYAMSPDTVNRANLLMMLTPSGLKGFTEEAVRKDAQGRVLDSKGLPVNTQPRSESDWTKRKYSGVSLLNETIENQDLFKDKEAQAIVEKNIKDKSIQVKQAFIGNDFTRMSKLLQEYTQLAGPEATKALLDELGNKTQVDKNIGARQRAQGIPSTLRGVQKYENYNDGN